jgi:osmoprotectant transport system ATP-binding protein
MIQLQDVSKSYNNTKAVDNISFEVNEGETVVLLGTSGCGKTTTLRMINRLAETTTGNIFVNGQNIKQQEPEQLRRGIGYVLQQHGLFPHYTVAENISIVPDLLKWDKQKIHHRTIELLNKLQLPEAIAASYPSELSGGQQQRVGLARALAASPPVLLMDEPFGALDPVTRVGIRKEFRELDELKKKTILMVTHDVQEAFELSDRVCLMDKGKIVQIGKSTELLFNPANSFVASFLKEQRFQLELESILVKDIWTLLSKAIDGTDEKLVSTGDNLWNLLEMISTGRSEYQRYVAVEDGEKKQIDAASLMAAYTQYKSVHKYE